jgi:hypothetical protein
MQASRQDIHSQPSKASDPPHGCTNHQYMALIRREAERYLTANQRQLHKADLNHS